MANRRREALTFAMSAIMRNCPIIILFFCALALIASGRLHAGDEPKTVLVHYMPWYSSKPASGQWGWH